MNDLEALIFDWEIAFIPEDPDLDWFWTPEWQEGERRASADIRAGRVTHYETDEAFLEAFDAPAPTDPD